MHLNASSSVNETVLWLPRAGEPRVHAINLKPLVDVLVQHVPRNL